MSGAKIGTVPVGATLMAPAVVAVAGVAVLIGGGAAALAVTGRGIINVGQKTYDAIDQKVGSYVKEEMKRHQERLHKLLTYNREDNEQINKLYESIIEEPHPSEITKQTIGGKNGSFDEIMRRLGEIVKERQEIEKARDLSPKVSDELKEKIKEIKKRKEEIIKAKKKRKEEIEQEPDFSHFRREIYAKCDIIRFCYPDRAKEIEKRTKNISGKEAYDDVIYDLNKIIERLERHSKTLSELAEIYHGLKDHTLTREYLSESDWANFVEQFRKQRELVETGQCIDFGELRGLKANLLGVAAKKEREKRFQDNVANAIKAMNAAGYDTVEEKQESSYKIITGIKENGEKASCRFKLPDTKDKGLPDFKLDIHQRQYQTKEEWIAAGKLLMKEIESFGLRIGFKEAMTHFKGVLIPEAEKFANDLLTGSSIKVNKILGNDLIELTDGRTIAWPASIDPEQIIEQIRKGKEVKESRRICRKQRIKD